MKYFLHDTNAFQDEKVSELYINFGYEGLGLFFTILEKLAAQEKPIKTIVLKRQLNVGKKLEKCWQFMESLGIISSNNGETFNKQLLNYSEKYKIKKEKNIERVSQWRENQKYMENVTRYESVRNAPKVKVSKVNVNNDKNVYSTHTPVEKIEDEKFRNFVIWYIEKADNVNKLPDPITLENFNSLMSKYEKDFIAEVILDMNNHKDLNKKYVSAYRTLNSWIKIRLNGSKH